MRVITASACAVVLLSIAALPVTAQYDEKRPYPSTRNSAFDLYASGDLARTSMRMQGEFIAYNINSGPGDDFGGPGISGFNIIGVESADAGESVFQFFGFMSPFAGAPKGEWLRHLDEVPSLANALPEGPAQGFTAIINLTSFGEPRQFWPADGEFGTAFRGVQSTEDGTCLDHSQTRGGYGLEAGASYLLAGSNCPPTWPLVNGVPTFKGGHPVPAESWIQVFNNPGMAGMTPGSFRFAWWRVPQSFEEDEFFGTFATYGTYNDFNSTTLAKFGNVVPGQEGEPILPGWPLGLEFHYDAFSYALPPFQNIYFWRATMVNKSAEVYGVGLDYDSLYIGFAHETGRTQEGAVYFDADRNTIWSAEGGTSGTADCNGGVELFGADCDNLGFSFGATAVVVLKSPIGDMRNEMFTNPQSPFYDPANPFRGDTITFNHGHLCDYGDCFTALGGLSADPRKLFGFYSSKWRHLLYNRSLANLPADVKAITFRNPCYPDEVVPFAFTVPGETSSCGTFTATNPNPTWSYSRRPESAPAGPDTLWFDNCGPAGCSVVWSDTMAAPGHYINQESNNGMFGIGPFRLEAGDTVGLVFAMIGATDSASLEQYVANAIQFYKDFWLAPSAAPPVRIISADVVGQDEFGPESAEVTLFLNDALEQFVDPYLLDFAAKLEAAEPGSENYRILQLNPELPARIRERARNNIERLFVFKSCDGGSTFTGNGDCQGDPAESTSGDAIGAGWQAYAILEESADGFPNIFEDDAVIAGRSYLYVFAAQTRGARFAIVDSVDTDGDNDFDNVGPSTLEIAPSITNSLTSSVSEPNVVSVYVPASRQAGSVPASVAVDAAGTGPATTTFEVVPAGDAPGGEFLVTFGNRLTITERVVAGTGAVESVEVVVADAMPAVQDPGGPNEQFFDPYVLRADTFTTTSSDGVTVAGDSLLSQTTNSGVTTTVSRIDQVGFLLSNSESGKPLLVTGVLEPDRTTPGAFIGRSDFPGFFINADIGQGGSLLEASLYLNEQGDTILGRVEPDLVWNDLAEFAVSSNQLGEYVITWSGPAFGADAPFRLDRVQPENTDQAFDASLRARADATIGRTGAEVATLVGAALDIPGIGTDDLVAVKLPFTIRNATMARDVEVAMLARSDSTVLLGEASDTLRVSVPPDEWIPGDELAFLETVTVDSTILDSNEIERVVLDANGEPITMTRLAVTLTNASLICDTGPRESCNPVIGEGATGFLGTTAGQTLNIEYGNPFDTGTAYTITVTPAVTGPAVMDEGSIANLDNVRVVPNPYIVFSRYEQTQQGRRVLFTNLPPKGVIRIYTSIGEFVQQITWTQEDLSGGDIFYDLTTHEGNTLASGLYLFVVKAQDPATGATRSKIGKFVVIR